MVIYIDATDVFSVHYEKVTTVISPIFLSRFTGYHLSSKPSM